MNQSSTKVEAITLRQRVANALREAILSGGLKPGERLREVDLAERFGVSRNPVREAIGELEQQGLIVSVPNQGKAVVSPTECDLQHAFEVRLSLELLALRTAWPALTPERLAEMRRLVEEMRRLQRDVSQDATVRHGRLNLLDGRFHSLLVEWSENKALRRAWEAATPWGLTFIKDLEKVSTDSQEPPTPATDPHEELLDALERRDLAAAEAALRTHIMRHAPAGARYP